MKPLYQILATFVFEYESCKVLGNDAYAAWFKSHIEEYVRKYMPRGPEIGPYYKLHLDHSDSQRLVFTVDIQGKTHQLTVTPCLHSGIKLTIGEPRTPDKHYHEAFAALHTLRDEVRV